MKSSANKHSEPQDRTTPRVPVIPVPAVAVVFILDGILYGRRGGRASTTPDNHSQLERGLK